MGLSMMVLGYLGPETMLPMTSVVAGVVGMALLLGKNSLRWGLGIARVVVSKLRPRSKAARLARKVGPGPVGRIAASKVDRPRARS